MIFFQMIWIPEEPDWAQGVSDEELVERYQKTGDQMIIVVLLERYDWLLKINFAKYMTDAESVQELAHVVYCRLSVKLKEVQIKNKFSSWLFQVVQRMQIDKVIRLGKKGEKEGGFYERHYPDNPFNKIDPIDKERILGLIQQILKPVEYQIIIGKYFYQKPHEEISKELGLNVRTVQNKCSLAVKKIRQKFHGSDLLNYFLD